MKYSSLIGYFSLVAILFVEGDMVDGKALAHGFCLPS